MVIVDHLVVPRDCTFSLIQYVDVSAHILILVAYRHCGHQLVGSL